VLKGLLRGKRARGQEHGRAAQQRVRAYVALPAARKGAVTLTTTLLGGHHIAYTSSVICVAVIVELW
jgi:hypothetical protein